ncbi:TonB-dependent receptor plug domain-containing protein [Saccharicrinis sp. FJH54]|uniref:TonB-dependent receptor plug domain-containing protein n=1 Tax=Saccharicrinis sp. FJH54 TaxID=3344665 RepID=UPI0035D49528
MKLLLCKTLAVICFVLGISSPVRSQSGNGLLNKADSLINQASEKKNVFYEFGSKNDGFDSGIVFYPHQSDRGFFISPEELIIGRIPGLQITSNGIPGGSSTLLNRGTTSLYESNAPLMVVDNIIMYNADLSIVNPNDIESFTYINDASAAAIYGYEANNGVIIITTKKAHSGDKLRISYKTNFAFSTPGDFVDVYSGDEFRQIIQNHKDLYEPEAMGSIGSANTNWQKEIFRKTISQIHNLSISGARKIPYRISLVYVNQNGVLKNTGQEKFIGSLDVHPSFLKDNLKLNINIKGLKANQNHGDVNAIGSAISMDPTQLIMDGNVNSNGYFQWENYDAFLGTPNPLEQILEADHKSVNNRFMAYIQLDYRLPVFKNSKNNEFKVSLNFGADHSQTDGYDNRPVTSPVMLTQPYTGRLSDYSFTNNNDQLGFSLKYRKYFTPIKSEISAMAGFFWNHAKKGNSSYIRSNVDETNETYYPYESIYWTENYKSLLFGRLNYSLMDKYLLSCIVNSYANSRFPYRHNTLSLLLAWKIKEEAFLKNSDFVSGLKLKLGYGPLNLDNDANTEHYTLYESIKQLTLGMDFGLIKNRISGTFSTYKISSENLLISVNIPRVSNYSNSFLTNSGSIENTGYSCALFLKPLSKENIDLTVGFHLSHNRNTVRSLYSNAFRFVDEIYYGSGLTGTKQVTRVGYPVFSYYLNKQVYDNNGNPIEGLYVDFTGEGANVNNLDNRYIYKNPAPEYLMGLSCQFNYRNLDISFGSRIHLGNYVYNEFSAGSSYDQIYPIDYWKNQSTSLSSTNFIKRQFSSDYFVENASFLKLDHFSIGYKFEPVLKRYTIDLYFSAQNVLTLTSYSGRDPEVADGTDYYSYPRPEVYSLGINVDF